MTFMRWSVVLPKQLFCRLLGSAGAWLVWWTRLADENHGFYVTVSGWFQVDKVM